FFFSSRRRHTRFSRDWSSDVCSSDLRGFALTLGVTTIIDVLIVILFTHPMLQLLATTRFFSSGHPATGLDPTALGAVYRGRAERSEERRVGREGGGVGGRGRGRDGGG